MSSTNSNNYTPGMNEIITQPLIYINRVILITVFSVLDIHGCYSVYVRVQNDLMHAYN